MRGIGEMPEWSNGTDSKSVVLATVPRVQIPISPPYKMKPRRLTSAGLFRFYIVLLIYYFISGLGMTSFSSQYVAWIKVCIGQSLVPRT